jgi:hypothetical membrane protein
MLIKLNGDRIARFLLLFGVFAPITMMVIIIVVGQITPNYNPISDTISQLGAPNKPNSIVLNTGFVIYGTLIGGVAYGFYRRLRYVSLARILAILLSIHGIGGILLGIFPDSPITPDTHFTDDILHNTLSGISYSALLVGILVFIRIARQEKAFKVAAILGLAVVILNLPLPVITVFDPFKQISGLLQRLFIASSFLWLALTSLLLYKNHLNIRD